MDELKINPKFKQLLPPLSPAEYEILQASILEKGVEEKIQVWKGFIIDGHNRYEIARQYDLAVAVADRSFEFETEEQVLQWIYEHQLGRRNLGDNVRTEIIGRYYQMTKGTHGGDRKSENQVAASDHLKSDEPEIEPPEEVEVEHYVDEIADEIIYETDEYSQVEQPIYNPQPARKKAAHTYGVSESKVKRADQYVKALDQVPEEVQEKAREGKISQAEVIRTAAGEERPVKKAFDKKEMKRLISKIAFEIESIATKCPDSREECDKALAYCRSAQDYTGV